MKDIKTLIILILCSILCMAAVTTGGKGTYQAVLSDDGITLVVVDTRNGAYKVREVELGDNEKALFDAEERSLKDWGGHQTESFGRSSLFKSSEKSTLFKSPEETNLFK